MLNEALATELVCVLRYKRHYYMADGINSASVAAEFLQHATEEQGHADQIAARIVQLQGEPDFNPATLVDAQPRRIRRGHRPDRHDQGRSRRRARRHRLVREIVRWLGDGDITTRRLMESILAVEEEHADDLLTFLKQFGVDL